MKSQRAKWYTVASAGLSVLMLATSQAQANQLAKQYESQPHKFIVAQANSDAKVMPKALLATKAERQKLRTKLIAKAKQQGINVAGAKFKWKYKADTKKLTGFLVSAKGVKSLLTTTPIIQQDLKSLFCIYGTCVS